MAYDKEQQKLDIAIVDATIAALGARLIGEKLDICEGYLADYIRISRFWAAPRFIEQKKQMPVLHMFIDLTRSPRISAFSLSSYEKLLKETRKMIQAKLFFRRRQTADNCSSPEVHDVPNGCFCKKFVERKAKTLRHP